MVYPAADAQASAALLCQTTRSPLEGLDGDAIGKDCASQRAVGMPKVIGNQSKSGRA